MDFIIQLLNLNYKTVIQLIKIYVSLVLTAHWSNINIDFNSLISSTNMDFMMYFMVVFILFHIVLAPIIAIINFRIVKRLVYKVERNGSADEFPDFVSRGGSILEKGFNDPKGTMIRVIKNHSSIAHTVLFDCSVILLQIALIKINTVTVIVSALVLIITPLFMAGMKMIKYNEPHRN